MTDRELIETIKSGGEDGLEELISQYGAYVLAVISRVSRGMLSREDSEELAADVFTAFWKNAQTFCAEQGLKPWLAKTARNMTVSRWREKVSAQERQTVSLEDDRIADDRIAVEKEGTDELAMKREQREILNRAVGALGEAEREIFVRFYFFNEKIAEIARRLGIPPSTVKTKLRRGRAKLREALEERGYTCYEN